MNTIKIYLDDERQTPEGWTRCFWPQEVIELLKNNKVSHVSLDHDLGDDQRGTGYDVLKWIEEEVHTNERYFPPFMVVHSANPAAKKRMEAAISSIYSHVLERGKESIERDFVNIWHQPKE